MRYSYLFYCRNTFKPMEFPQSRPCPNLMPWPFQKCLTLVSGVVQMANSELNPDRRDCYTAHDPTAIQCRRFPLNAQRKLLPVRLIREWIPCRLPPTTLNRSFPFLCVIADPRFPQYLCTHELNPPVLSHDKYSNQHRIHLACCASSG